MARRLGLDIGTNSIGWCLTEDDSGIVDIGVRIFADGREPPKAGPVGKPLGEGRRVARGMRRRRDRYLGRRSAFLEALVTHGLMPVDVDEAKRVAGMEPYRLRAEALERALTPYEIGRALFHLNQRRGFKSNRKAERKTKESEGGVVASGAEALDHEMADTRADTLGQFLHRRLTHVDEHGRPKPLGARVRMDSDSQTYDFYPQRRHYEHEFARIWEEQAKHHPTLLTEAARTRLYDILFYQRPLKEQKVGLCTFAGRHGVMANETRLPKAHPLFQERRLYEEVNQLRITTPGEAEQPLSRGQRDRLILELRDNKERAFTALARKLDLQPGQSFNKASPSRKTLAGNAVRATMGAKDLFGERWLRFDRDAQWRIIDRILEEPSPQALRDWLEAEFAFDDDQIAAAERAARTLPDGYGRIGATASARILDELEKDVCTYAQAVERCGWHHSDERTGEDFGDTKERRLPYYGELLSREIPPGSFDPADLAKSPPDIERYWGKITNPTVHIGLRQLEKLVNAIIVVHGRPDDIVIELARELKLSEKEKEARTKQIAENTAAAKKRSDYLLTIGQRDNGANRALLRVWQELAPGSFLDRACPYCGEMMSPTMLFDGRAQVDHIIPYSKCLDDSFANKVAVHRSCNQKKGNDTPWEAFHGTDRWDQITAQVAKLQRSKQWRFGPDALERVNREDGFIARQLTDTQYLSRLANRYVSSLYPETGEGSRHVYVITGRMTAMLRRLWQLNGVLLDEAQLGERKRNEVEKSRLDHRHHAIDAFVVAMSTPSLIQRVATAAARAEEKELDRMFERLPEPWPGYLGELRAKLDAVVVSHKPDHGRKGRPGPGRDVTTGKLHNDTAYGLTRKLAADGKTPVVVHRVPLTSLKPADLSDADRIADPALRDALRRATDGKSGKDYEQALKRFSREGSDGIDCNGERVFRGVRRVRVIGERAGAPSLSVIKIHDKTGKPYKAYKGSSNDRFEIWRCPDGSWKSKVVQTFEANQKEQRDTRPHPAAKKILSLKQKDVIAIERDGARALMVVQQIWPKQINLVGHRESGNLDKRDKDPGDTFKFFAPTAGGLKKMKARQVRIDPLGRIFDPGPR